MFFPLMFVFNCFSEFEKTFSEIDDVTKDKDKHNRIYFCCSKKKTFQPKLLQALKIVESEMRAMAAALPTLKRA